MYGVKWWHRASGGRIGASGASIARGLLSHHAVCKHLFRSEGCIKMSGRTRLNVGPKGLESGTSGSIGKVAVT
jgi:hypothetical protein